MRIFEFLQVRYDYLLYRPSGDPWSDVDRLAGLNPLQMKIKNDDAWRGESSYDVIVLGDSSAVAAIQPDEIVAGTKLTAYNLANYLVDGPRAPYYLLDNYLRHASKPPRYVVICLISLAFLTDEHRDGIEYTYVRGNRLNILRDLGLGRFLKAQIPTLHHQTYFRDLFAHPGEFSSADFETVQGEIERLRRAKGTVPYHPENVVMGSATWPARFPVVSPIVQKSLEDVIARATGSGASVLLLLAPCAPAQAKYESNREPWQSIVSLLSQAEDSNDRVRFLNLRDKFMSNEYFADMFHLNRVGYERFNALIAAEIRRDIRDSSAERPHSP